MMLLRCILPLVVVAVAVATSIGPSAAATDSTVVGATVPSATHVDDDGCPPLEPGITNFGSVLPGGPGAVTSGDCIVEFGSSNDTATLHVSQSDADGAAMYLGDRGDLDVSWGTNGTAAFPLDNDREFPRAMARQDDGKLVVVGTTEDDHDWFIERFNADGTPDTSFAAPSGSRVFEIQPGEDYEMANALAIQPDGSIVVVGGTGQRTGIARFEPDGDFDTSFAGGGRTTFEWAAGSAEYGSAVALQSDGSIVVAGGEGSYIARLTSLGAQDMSFAGGAGVFDLSTNDATSLIVDPSDRIFVAEHLNGASTGRVYRLTPDAGLDLSWGGGDGWTEVPFAAAHPTATQTAVRAMQLQPDGTLYVVYNVWHATNVEAGVARFDEDGVLDTSWAGDGAETMLTGSWVDPTGIDVRADGSVVIVGRRTDGDSALFLGGFGAGGLVDPTYGDNGGWSEHDPLASFDQEGVSNPVLVGDGAYLVATSSWFGFPRRWDTVLMRIGSPPISQYESSGDGDDTDWSSGDATNMFGACLAGVSAGAVDGAGAWLADGDGDGNCGDGDGDPWHPIPEAAGDPGSLVARAPSTDDDALAHLRFGLRTADSQRPGFYSAPIVFTVVAPG